MARPHYPARMKTISCLLLASVCVTGADLNLKDALIFHASFDKAEAADFAKGNPALFSAASMKSTNVTAGLPKSGYVARETTGGKFGGHLRFHKKTDEMIFFRAEKNIAYNTNNFAGTVSAWLRVTPDEDLAPGYTDPIQITSKAWNDAAFFIEFTKDEVPREFRLGSYSDFKTWNPQNRKWEEIPFAEKPLIKVERPPFKREQWTHVVFTFANYNNGQSNAVTRLYLNGELKGAQTRQQTFTWKIEDAKIMLGLSYIGAFDELSIFNRALTDADVKQLHHLKDGVTSLLK